VSERPARIGDDLVTDLANCPRCGGAHPALAWRRMLRPLARGTGLIWAHAALCPTTDEPILLRADVLDVGADR
jgi:hypothetical protein